MLDISVDALARALKSLPNSENWYREFGSRPFNVRICNMLTRIRIAREEDISDATLDISMVFVARNSVRSKYSNYFEWVLIDYTEFKGEE